MTPAELRTLRGSRTIREFASIIGVTHGRVGDWEAGRRRITRGMAALIRERLHEAAEAA